MAEPVMDPHGTFMRAALDEARRALEAGEVPVGAIVVLDGQIIGCGFNQPIGANDPTAHAEIVALREASRARGNYRLVGTTLYVTIEPCLMCVGAMVSSCRAHELPSLNHRIEVVGGVLEDDCRAIIQEFFKTRR